MHAITFSLGFFHGFQMHRPSNLVEVWPNIGQSEWVEFNAPLDTIQVISEAEKNFRFQMSGSIWFQKCRQGWLIVILRSAKLQRHLSNRLDVLTNSNTTPSLLPNCRKLFLSLFYCFCKGRSHIGKTQKRHFVRFARNFTISRQNFANVSLTVGPREPIKFFNLLDGGRI